MFAVYMEIQRDFGLIDYDAIVTFDNIIDATKYMNWLREDTENYPPDIISFEVSEYHGLKHNLSPNEKWHN